MQKTRKTLGAIAAGAALLAGIGLLSSPVEADTAAAEATYKAKCASCHGPDGKGKEALKTKDFAVHQRLNAALKSRLEQEHSQFRRRKQRWSCQPMSPAGVTLKDTDRHLGGILRQVHGVRESRSSRRGAKQQVCSHQKGAQQKKKSQVQVRQSGC